MAFDEHPVTQFPDGNYDMANIIGCLNDDFKNEKDFVDYIELNIKSFCDEFIGSKYKSHKREYPIAGYTKRYRGSKRIDLVIFTQDNRRIAVECKKPKMGCELSQAIGQCLTYFAMSENLGDPFDMIMIVSTKIEWTLPITIDRFNLPIKFIALDKKKSLTYQNGSSSRQ